MSLSYRSKLLLAFVGLATLTAALVFFVGSRHSKRTVFKQIQSNVLSIC